MDDMNALDRQLASVVLQRVGPSRPVDDTAIFTAITANQTPKWRFQSMFSATKFVVAGAIVALFGGILLAGVLTQPGEESVPAVATGGPGTFNPTGSLAQPRAGHSATSLPDGRVLIFGGGHASVEVWDPATDAFGPAGSLTETGMENSTTLLPDGRVLVVGGGTAEIWDPATASSEPSGPPEMSRRGQTATLLPDGRVFVIGGGSCWANDCIEPAEVWDPSTASFGPAGASWARGGHTATLLPDGRVLLNGGGGSFSEVWDPATGEFSHAGDMAEGRDLHTATVLPDGRVIVVGGGSYWMGDTLVAEVWDPATMSFGATGSLAEGRAGHTATLLRDGRILVVGGAAGTEAGQADPDELDQDRDREYPVPAREHLSLWNSLDDDDTVLASAEVWDPATGSFSPSPSLAQGRWGHTATLLPDGRVLVVGGATSDGVVSSAEVWEPGDIQPEADATDDATTMAPAMFTLGLEDSQAGDGGTSSVTDEGHTLVTGYTHFGRVIDPSDPRMGGTYTSEANWIERDDGYPDLVTILYEIKNDGGRWIGISHGVGSCHPACPDSPAADFPATSSIVFTGVDGYEGLTAYVVGGSGYATDGSGYSPGDPYPMLGVIVAGEMPPDRELPVSSCTDYYTEEQCEFLNEPLDAP